MEHVPTLDNETLVSGKCQEGSKGRKRGQKWLRNEGNKNDKTERKGGRKSGSLDRIE